MAGHKSAALWPDIQLRDQIESDRVGRYVRRYAVNGAAPAGETTNSARRHAACCIGTLSASLHAR